MRRRELITAFFAVIAGWPLAARAQQTSKTARIGLVASKSDNPMIKAAYSAFVDQLAKLGWVEGRNLTIDYRYHNVPGVDLAAEMNELVKSGIDVLVSTGPEVALQTAMAATKTIPIAMIAVNFDPLERGYVQSLARPGGNVTGIFVRQIELAEKLLELISQAVPNGTRVAAIYDELSSDQFASSRKVAVRLKLELDGLKLEKPPYDFEQAFQALAKTSPQMLLVLSSPYFTDSQSLIASLAIRHRLPAMFIFKSYVEAGGLMSYGVDYVAMQGHIADFVAKILGGTKPADIPIEVPTKFELVVNLKTAKALGLTLSPALLARADEVIE
jgi:putative ABC transport system substrate-binding protein